MKYVPQVLWILFFSLLGEVLQAVIPVPIPASVWGLALLFGALCLGVVKVEQVQDVGGFLASILPVLFVSPAVGIAQNWGLIRSQIVPICLLLVVSTMLTFGISGTLTQYFRKKGGGEDA